MNSSKLHSELTSREYKLMLQPLMFASKSSRDWFTDEYVQILKRVGAELTSKSGFQKSTQQTIEFLDTKEHVFRRNNLLLRHRQGEGREPKRELTLKCRAADPFLVFDTRLSATNEKKAKAKLEEDICPPFISRLSRSITVPVKKRLPQTIDECFTVFEGLEVQLPSRGDRRLERVRDTVMVEETLTGFEFLLCDQPSEAALIFWRHSPKGRLAIVEFSFRYKVQSNNVTRSVAQAFHELFSTLQCTDWASSTSITKTSYMYGTRSDG